MTSSIVRDTEIDDFAPAKHNGGNGLENLIHTHVYITGADVRMENVARIRLVTTSRGDRR